jgi:hypothetical protein
MRGQAATGGLSRFVPCVVAQVGSLRALQRGTVSSSNASFGITVRFIAME